LPLRFLVMKKCLFPILFFFVLPALGQPPGYEIKITFKPFKQQYIYLGHYFGKQYPIIDSALLNEKSEAVFEGPNKLPGGIYLVGYPDKTGYFEILVDDQQRFSVIADSATVKDGIQFINSPDNVLFNSYQQTMNAKGSAINNLKKQLSSARTAADSAKLNAEILKLDKDVLEYREGLIKNNRGTILTALLIAMREPILPEKLQYLKTKEDSLAAYSYYKEHYWDGVNFYDGRLAYTTFFEDKLDKYFNQVVAPHPDSVIKEMDWMLGYASINEEMQKLLLIKFVNRYLNQKYMWEDAVFVHLFEKYFSQKNYSWLTEKGKKTITDRAYSLMANILGNPAEDIHLPDTSGKMISLYQQPGDFTIVAFWDPLCGHCREVMPLVDSFYQAKWKLKKLKVFAVAKENDGNKADWLKFIHDHKLKDWTHVYYSNADNKARINAGIPGYSQLYDVLSFPTLYLLDKNKRIIAKKLTVQQIDEVLDLKIKGQ